MPALVGRLFRNGFSGVCVSLSFRAVSAFSCHGSRIVPMEGHSSPLTLRRLEVGPQLKISGFMHKNPCDSMAMGAPSSRN